MKQSLLDYDISIRNSPIMCDNTSAINLSKNAIQHSRTKHIDIRHHFLCDYALMGNISVSFIPLNNQIADIFIKSIKKDIFMRFRRDLSIRNIFDI